MTKFHGIPRTATQANKFSSQHNQEKIATVNQMISTQQGLLWTYALIYMVHVDYTVPTLQNGISLLKLFSGIQVVSCMQDQCTFTCPVFALQNSLAVGNSIPGWSLQAQLALNLDPSPVHVQNLYLVLNLVTGLVSPQYHCHYNDFFETTHHSRPDITVSATWKQMAVLCRMDGTPTIRDQDQYPNLTWSSQQLHRMFPSSS